MPRVCASISLPYLLNVSGGMYRVGPQERELSLIQPPPQTPYPYVTQTGGPPLVVRPSDPKRFQRTTAVAIVEDQLDTENPEEQGRLNARQADKLLDLTNRLLRCYRAITQNPAITELSRAEASPFLFHVLADKVPIPPWEAELSFESSPPRMLVDTAETISQRVRSLLGSGGEPEVADLFLLDAERAMQEGRFREAVLFCWSTIDSTFNREYDKLVDTKLANEWSEARDFFKGVDFPLKKKMSAALFLVSGRSLFREPADLWQRLSSSYNKRNGVIHRGETADEDDALRALQVAREVVAIVRTLSKSGS